MSRSKALRYSVLALTVLALGAAALLLLPAPPADAAINASLVCEPFPFGAFCDASPYSSSYTYTWATTGGLTVTNGCTPSKPYCHVSCYYGSGSVSVTITAPGGSSGSDTAYIHCSPYGD